MIPEIQRQCKIQMKLAGRRPRFVCPDHFRLAGMRLITASFGQPLLVFPRLWPRPHVCCDRVVPNFCRSTRPWPFSGWDLSRARTGGTSGTSVADHFKRPFGVVVFHRFPRGLVWLFLCCGLFSHSHGFGWFLWSLLVSTAFEEGTRTHWLTLVLSGFHTSPLTSLSDSHGWDPLSATQSLGKSLWETPRLLPDTTWSFNPLASFLRAGWPMKTRVM